MSRTRPLTKPWLNAVLAILLALVATTSQATETITYIHWDALGSPVAVTDEAGNVIWREAYRPYGQRINNEAASAGNSRWYTGHPQDADTGLVYAGARYCDPAIGRFLGVDALGVQEGSLSSFNRYAYGNDSPYGYVDPDGRNPELLFATDPQAYMEYVLAPQMGVDANTRAGNRAVRRQMALEAAVELVGDAVGGAIGKFVGRIGGRILGRTTAVATESESLGTRTLKPGPYAARSIPGRSSARNFNAAERAEGNAIMAESGCHTCGSKIAGTKSGNAILDHQPVSRLNIENAPQRLYPHCLSCSKEQGLEVIRILRARGEL